MRMCEWFSFHSFTVTVWVILIPSCNSQCIFVTDFKFIYSHKCVSDFNFIHSFTAQMCEFSHSLIHGVYVWVISFFIHSSHLDVSEIFIVWFWLSDPLFPLMWYSIPPKPTSAPSPALYAMHVEAVHKPVEAPVSPPNSQTMCRT